MQRYKIIIEYDGTEFYGWQRQLNQKTVQGEIEAAIRKFAQESVHVQCSGRTDAGVHALAQVAHFDLEKQFDSKTVQGALNFHLRPNAICILGVEKVDDSFNARISATKRFYEYKILNRRAPTAILKNRVWHVKESLEIMAMQEAANLLIGHHDFSSFRASECQAKSPIKTMDAINISKKEEIISCKLEAQSFLHHMVRNIVGTLKLVGNNTITPAEVGVILQKKNRAEAGPTAPAKGLYLTGISYE